MKHSNMTNYTGKEIDCNILKLAWPAILSNISVPILGISDTFISGHLGSESYLAAMAVATTMVNSLFWLFGFLRMGTTGLTATAYGAGDDDTQDIIFSRAILIAIAAGVILIAACYPLFALMREIMMPPENVALYAFRYFMTIMLSAPATLATMAATGRLIGRQNTLYPM
ncbi:MAG: MATE family efflux transporter, partial [Muribaculaceae bacterium]|nr:MATE family efflux transporter [Muribaculaceae bacterium]